MPRCSEMRSTCWLAGSPPTCAWPSISPGMTVLPVASIISASAGTAISEAEPTASIRPSRTTSALSSRGVAPVPSISRPCRIAFGPCMAIVSGGSIGYRCLDTVRPRHRGSLVPSRAVRPWCSGMRSRSADRFASPGPSADGRHTTTRAALCAAGHTPGRVAHARSDASSAGGTGRSARGDTALYNMPRSLVQTATRPGSMVTVPPSGSGAVRGFS